MHVFKVSVYSIMDVVDSLTHNYVNNFQHSKNCNVINFINHNNNYYSPHKLLKDQRNAYFI